MATPAQDEQSSHSSHLSVCADCGTALAGPYCSQCGEHVIDRHSLTLWHFLNHNVLHEFSHVDGKIFRTFRYLIFRPGFLSVEYFAGRRQRYINPVRLLLTCLVILALLPAWATSGRLTMARGKLHLNLLPPATTSGPDIKTSIEQLDVFGILGNLMDKESKRKDLTAEASVEKFNHALKTYTTTLSFSIVILLAAFLALLYHWRRPLFVEHLVFSMHLASFVVLFSIVPGPLLKLMVKLSHGKALNPVGGAIAFSLIAIEMVYLYKAILRFYWPDGKAKKHWWSLPTWTTLFSVFAIFIANSIFITVTYAAGAAIALWRV